MGVLRALVGLLSPAEALQSALADDRARQAQEVFYGPGGHGERMVQPRP